MKRLTQQLQFLKEIEKMKMIYRKNTILDKTRMENDAEHSWTIALMAVVLCEYASSDIDITRVIKMLMLHDLVEIYAGDTYFLDNDHNSKQQEKVAAEKLYHLLPENQYDEFLEIWTEFEEMKTQNSIYANAIDRLQPFLLDSYTDGHSWKYGNINEQQLLDRLEPIKQLSPVIWESVLLILKQCKEAGDIN